MPAFDAPVLHWDPAKVALGVGGEGGGGAPSTPEEAANNPDPTSASCHAALAAQRTALMFQVAFTGLVFLVATASAVALVIAIYRLVEHGLDAGAVVSGVSGLLGSGATIFLGNKMNQAIKVQKQALEDVGKYCGMQVKQQVA